jgi:hypothetical protein
LRLFGRLQPVVRYRQDRGDHFVFLLIHDPDDVSVGKRVHQLHHVDARLENGPGHLNGFVDGENSFLVPLIRPTAERKQNHETDEPKNLTQDIFSSLFRFWNCMARSKSDVHDFAPHTEWSGLGRWCLGDFARDLTQTERLFQIAVTSVTDRRQPSG